MARLRIKFFSRHCKLCFGKQQPLKGGIPIIQAMKFWCNAMNYKLAYAGQRNMLQESEKFPLMTLHVACVSCNSVNNSDAAVLTAI